MVWRGCWIRTAARHLLQGAIGFWKGVTASYWGISETVIHFVIYESLKKRVTEYQSRPDR